ncbi:MAG: flavin monoamine oxidase family protein [Thermoleophilaceae bacterium]
MKGRDAPEVDVAIVGAGLAGLAAARALAAAGASFMVLEARDRVGGRTLNEPIGDGKVVEVGGQWIGPTQHRLAALARELDVETFPTYGRGENLIEWRGGLRRYRGTLPKLGPHVLADVAQAQARLDRMARTVPPEAPWSAPKAGRWDGQTFATWLARNVATPAARGLLRLVIEAVWAVEPEDVSLLHVLFYIRSAGDFDALLDTEGGAQQDRFVGGSQLVSLRMAEALGDAVALEAPVRRIRHGHWGVELESDAMTVRARRAILAMPPVLTARVAYDPPLAGYRDGMTQRMPQGAVIKCMAVYDEPFWRADGLSGQGLSDTGPAKLTYDNSPPDGSPGVLLGFLEGRQARELGRLPVEERRERVLTGFARLFGPRAARPERWIERSWADEEWTRGCYGCSFTTGGWTGYGRALREPIGPLHWAGAETAVTWNGYMDGALESGERAARETLEALPA